MKLLFILRYIENLLILLYMYFMHINMGSPGGSDVEESACNAADPGLTPGSGRSPGEGNGSPLWYSCLENPMDRETWRAIVHGVTKSWTRLSD